MTLRSGEVELGLIIELLKLFSNQELINFCDSMGEMKINKPNTVATPVNVIKNKLIFYSYSFNHFGAKPLNLSVLGCLHNET